jgi:hypothetical protein
VVCVLLRQVRNAVQEEDADEVASAGEAEEEWWMVLEVEAWVIGNVVVVCMGALLTQSGMVEDGDDIVSRDVMWWLCGTDWEI